MKKRLNKTAIMISTLALAVGFMTACGKEEKSTTTEAVSEDTTEAEKEEASTEADSDKSAIDATLWTINYDSSVWSYDEEEDYSDSESSSSINLAIPGEDDDNIVSVEINASVTTPYDFRDKLYDRGFDEYEYEVNGAYDRAEIGGAEFVYKQSTYWGSDCIYYMSRIENANETIYIGYTEEKIDKLPDGTSANQSEKYIHFAFKDTMGLSDFYYAYNTPKKLADYFNRLYGIQKTLGNIGNTWKNQINAAKAMAAGVKAVKNGAEDAEDKAAEAVNSLDVAIYGDRTELNRRAAVALEPYGGL